MNNQVDKVMKAVQEMPENKLTNEVIIPLLRYLGYKKVEFYGGIDERGKDIVFWEESKIGRDKLIVAQVKHFKASNKASGNDSFQTIVNQLVMCFEDTLIHIDKQIHKPKEAMLISTHPINIKTLQTRFSSIPLLPVRNIEIIDGYLLANLLIENEQPIVKQILGNTVNFTKYFENSLNNQILLKALGFFENIALKNIYTDIDFSLGKNTTELFFKSKFSGQKTSVQIDSEEWQRLQTVINEGRQVFGDQYLSQTIEEVSNAFLLQKEKIINWENEKKEEKEFIESETVKLKQLKNDYNPFQDKLKQFYLEKSKIKEQIGVKAEDKKRLKEIDAEILKIEDFRAPIDELEESILKLKKVLKAKEKKGPNLIVNCEIDGFVLSKLLNDKRREIEQKVKIYNEFLPNVDELKVFINSCKLIIDSSSKILTNKSLLRSINRHHSKYRSDFESTRFKLPINKIFDTGQNITLLGEAGAGKTTCLQMYAMSKEKNNEKLFVWGPLAYILQNWSKTDSNKLELSVEQEEKIKIETFDTAIFEYLVSKGICLDVKEFQHVFISRKSTLLLDGIDEAIKNNPWLPRAIVNLTKKYKNAQIIITSRMSGDYIDEFPFFTTTLLPFTDEQRDDFIHKWFGDGQLDVVEKIKKHLSTNESINKITRNPLLTTTLCVLARHKLPLPQTEIKLYSDRLRLLAGYYDSVKSIETRISTTPQNLELLAQKLAFYLHKEGVREMYCEALEEESIKILRNLLPEEDARQAFKELIEPCNILLPMTSDGKFGFGHLRYQEHLAAVELVANRSIDIERFFTNDWWHDTLILFAHMSDSLEWLIKNMEYRSTVRKVKEMAYKMLSVRPVEEQNAIKEYMNRKNKELDNIINFVDEYTPEL
jgi:flagellar biosynthesis GTPase FlhF